MRVDRPVGSAGAWSARSAGGSATRVVAQRSEPRDCPEKARTPVGASAETAAPSGVLRWTHPPSIDRPALTFVSTCSHRPSRCLERLRGGRCRFSDCTCQSPDPWSVDTVVPARLPERFERRRRDPSSSEPVGMASIGSSPTTTPSCRAANCLAPGGLARSRLPGIPQVAVDRGYPRPRSDPTPLQLPAPDADPALRTVARDSSRNGR